MSPLSPFLPLYLVLSSSLPILHVLPASPVSSRFLLQGSTQTSSLLKSHLEHCSSLFSPLYLPNCLIQSWRIFTETYECFAVICKILCDLAPAHFSFFTLLQQNGWGILHKTYFLLRMLSLWLAAAKSLQSCPTLCDPIDSSPPGSPVPGILQARTLEWVAISYLLPTHKHG